MGEYWFNGKKRGMLLVLILFLFLLTFVSAESSSTCNPLGKIYCSNTGTCLDKFSGTNFTDTEITQKITADCVISDDQTITINDDNGASYFAKKITIEKSLRFRSEGKWGFNALTTPCDYPEQKGGSAGSKGYGDACDGGAGGGGEGTSGGNGGDICKSGDRSWNAPGDGGWGVSSATLAGTKVAFFANTLIINGELLSTGYPGNIGGNSRDDDSAGYGGAGGSGGTGGGVFILNVADIVLNGTIDVSGGAGGMGGQSNNEDGAQCESCDSGGAGGGGGGGAGGYVISPVDLPANKINCTGGMGGFGGCTVDRGDGTLSAFSSGQTPSAGENGNPGASLASCIIPLTANTELCNDKNDNDLDTFIDMADSDCFLNTDGGWSNTGPINPLLYTSPALKSGINISLGKSYYASWNPSALNGSDAVCGDDFTCAPKNLPVPCTSISNDTECADKGCTWIPIATSCSGYVDCNNFSTSSGDCNASAPPDPICRQDFIDYRGNFCGGAIYCDSLLLQSECIKYNADGCNWNPAGGSCSGGTTTNECVDLSITDCAANSGCDLSFNAFTADYGFINNQYLCYNYRSDLRAVSIANKNKWSWLSASNASNTFKIFTLNNDIPNRTTDVIANGAKWFYCNANSNITQGLQGEPTREGSSFEQLAGKDKYYCSELMSKYINTGRIFTACTGSNRDYCCVPDESYTITGNEDLATAFNACTGDCYINSTTSVNDYCANGLCAGTGNPNVGSDYGNKDDCVFDTSTCNADFTSSTCGYLNGSICNNTTQICRNGIYVTAQNNAPNSGATDFCCYSGQNSAYCADRPIITDNSSCAALGFVSFESPRERCVGDWSTALDGSQCCFSGNVMTTPEFGNSWFNALKPDAFICYLQNQNNIISECAFDTRAANGDLLLSYTLLDYTSNRIKSKGTQFNTITSFDNYNGSNIVDRYRIIYMNAGRMLADNALSVASWPSMRGFMPSDYTSLEFEIALPYVAKDVQVSIDTNDSGSITTHNLGPVLQYMPAGFASQRWRHVILPLNQSFSTSGELYRIQFTDPSVVGRYNFSIDLITLIPDANKHISSNNQFCTGGFGTWVTDLDPDRNSPNITQWEYYGQYKFVCDAQGPFGWSGTQCCGDDTRFNYGEFYTDNAGACFNGTVIRSGQTVSYIYNVENSNSFDSFFYKDLIFYNGAFHGCQVPENKYSDLTISFNGLYDIHAPSIFDYALNNHVDECVVIGNYYCSAGAWHKITATQGAGTNIARKEVPAGGNLIFNGGFDQ